MKARPCLFIVLLFVLLTGKAIAQQHSRLVAGRVTDENKSPVPGAVLRLYSTQDKLLTELETDEKGTFHLALPANTGYLYVTHIGFFPYKILQFPSDSVIVVLKQAPVQLNEIKIKDRIPFIEQEADKMVVNVNGDSKAGINAVDILKKVPGIAIKNSNQILLEGRPVTIMVNGKQVSLTGDDLMNLLNQTSSVSISQLEVIQNPSAKYDAQGDGGIINIKTIKRLKPGYDINIAVTGGHGWKYFQNNGISTDFNYRKGNENIFGSYSYGFGKQYQELRMNTILTDINQKLIDSTIYRTHYQSQNFTAGWDHYTGKADVLGFLLTGFDNHYDPHVTAKTGIYSLNSSTSDSTKLSDNAGSRTSKGLTLNINFKHVLDSVRRQQITFDIDGGRFRNNYNSPLTFELVNASSVPLTPVDQLSQISQATTDIYSFKSDYTQRFLKGSLEAGVKGSYVRINNDFSSIAGYAGSPPHDNGSNVFLYKEAIIAGYANFTQTFSDLTIQAGLRGEGTKTTGNSVTLDSVVNRNYLNIFPNFQANLKLKKSSFNLSYSRRIGRPPYNYLNPFIITNSAFVVIEGNPFLKPSFSTLYRFAYNMDGKFLLSVSYGKTTDVITDLKLQNDSTKVTTNIKSNLDSYTRKSATLSYNNKLFGDLQINYSVTAGQSDYTFRYINSPVSVSQQTVSLSLDNTLQLHRNWWLELYFYGQSRATYGSETDLPFSSTSFSGGKKIWQGRGNFAISINDIFFTNITRGEARYGNVNYNVTSKYDSRNIRLSFAYRFNNSNVSSRSRKSGDEEELRRTQH